MAIARHHLMRISIIRQKKKLRETTGIEEIYWGEHEIQ